MNNEKEKLKKTNQDAMKLVLVVISVQCKLILHLRARIITD